MPGPVAYGVHKAVQKQTARPRPPARWWPGQGWAVFVITTMCLSWLVAGILADVWVPDDERLTVRLWWASIYYAVAMGWQPLVAAWIASKWRDHAHRSESGMQWPRGADIGLAALVATGLAAFAMIVAGLGGEPAHAGSPFDAHVDSALAATAAMLVLCIQAVTEEYGWRGAPLSYAIERWGRAGLVVHGMMWGVWYAPLFALSSPAPRDNFAVAGGFIITCMLLGVVFGWLRLRSRSVLPSAVANALLTIVAGLPLLLRDGSAGIRDAVFRWPGWPVLGIAAVAILVAQRRELRRAS